MKRIPIAALLILLASAAHAQITIQGNSQLSVSGAVGTVTAITPGTGLTSSPNPIIGSGTISADTTLLAQKFFGTAAPGSVAGNLPGDFYSDTTNRNDYWCDAAPGTATPACTSVTVGGWTLLNGGAGIITSGTAWSPTFYGATGSTVVGTTPFTGLEYWAGSAAPAAASAAQVVAAIGSTAVTNATNAAVAPASGLTGTSLPVGITTASGLTTASGGAFGTGAYAAIGNYAPLAGATFTGAIVAPNVTDSALSTANGVLYAGTGGLLSETAAGVQGQFTQMGASTPGWSGYKLPLTAGTNGLCVISNGTDLVTGSCATGSMTGTLTTNSLPYASGTSALSDSLLSISGAGQGLGWSGTAGFSLTGSGTFLKALEGAAPTGSAGSDWSYADSTAHRWKVKNNSNTADTLSLFSDNLSVFAAGGAIAPATVNALTLASLATGFSVAGGTASRTLTVDATVSTSALAPLASPTLTGAPVAPTPGSNINTTQIPTTAWVNTYYGPLASPTFTGTVTIPSGASISGFATLASPTFTGTPAAPTPGSNINTTQLPTTAWVNTWYAPLANPTFTGTVNGTFSGALTGNVTGNVSGSSGSTTGNAATATSAGKWTTARNLAGNSVDGSAAVTFTNKFWVGGTADAGLSSPYFLGALGTGIVKNTTTTGVPSIAASSDVIALWSGTCSGSTYLNGSGACSTPSGAGNVSTSGSPAQYQLGVFSGATSVTGIATAAAGIPFLSGGASAYPAYGALNLAGGSSIVTGTLPSGNLPLSAMGTITGGTWNGSVVDVAHGGSGANTLNDHSVLVGSGAGAITTISVCGTGTVLAGISAADPACSPTPVLGSTTLGAGSLGLSNGAGGGVVTLQALGGTYNNNFPVTAGTSGYALHSAGGGASPQTWGLDANSTLSNLGTMALNTNILCASSGSCDIGSSGVPVGNGYFSGNLVIGGTITTTGTGANQVNYTLNSSAVSNPGAGVSGYSFDTTANGGVFAYYENGVAVSPTAALAAKAPLINPVFNTPSLGTTPLTTSYTNEGSTGTATNLLAKLTAANPSTIVKAATSDVSGVIGICVSGCGTTSTSQIATRGQTSCVADASVTAGDYVTIGTNTAGRCGDSGAATFPTSGQVIGRWLATGTVGNATALHLFGPGDYGAPAGGTIVTSSSPGVGLCHFAGSTQACTSSAVNLAGGSGEVTGILPQANIAAAATVVGSGTITIPSGKSVLVICTSTCSIPAPVPAAGYQLCAKNIAGGATVITLSALGSSAMYPKSNDSGYGTAGTGTMVSTAAAGNKVCLIGRDATHYELGSVNASANWTVN